MPFSWGWKTFLALAGGVLLASILYFFHPEQYAFYPKCLLYKVTGWQCPGCGGLRAGYYFLHGQFTTALTYNPLLMLLGGALTLATLFDSFCLLMGRPVRFLNRFRQPAWIWTILSLAVLFGLGRNLPWF
jgi:hypothetical protein